MKREFQIHTENGVGFDLRQWCWHDCGMPERYLHKVSHRFALIAQYRITSIQAMALQEGMLSRSLHWASEPIGSQKQCGGEECACLENAFEPFAENHVSHGVCGLRAHIQNLGICCSHRWKCFYVRIYAGGLRFLPHKTIAYCQEQQMDLIIKSVLWIM